MLRLRIVPEATPHPRRGPRRTVRAGVAALAALLIPAGASAEPADARIDDVVAHTRRACAFEPEARSVRALLPLFERRADRIGDISRIYCTFAHPRAHPRPPADRSALGSGTATAPVVRLGTYEGRAVSGRFLADDRARPGSSPD